MVFEDEVLPASGCGLPQSEQTTDFVTMLEAIVAHPNLQRPRLIGTEDLLVNAVEAGGAAAVEDGGLWSHVFQSVNFAEVRRLSVGQKRSESHSACHLGFWKTLRRLPRYAPLPVPLPKAWPAPESLRLSDWVLHFSHAVLVLCFHKSFGFLSGQGGIQLTSTPV